jgi:hypothetical protein
MSLEGKTERNGQKKHGIKMYGTEFMQEFDI